MNTQDRDEIERHFAMRFAADPAQRSVDYETYVEDVPDWMFPTPTKTLWFDVVGEGVFSRSLLKSLRRDVYRDDVVPLVFDGVATGRSSFFSPLITAIGFSFDA